MTTGSLADGEAARAVVDTLQRVYGDATQTVLDHRAAVAVVETLRQMGWMSQGEFALVLEAAGGTVTVPGKLLADGRRREVTWQDDYRTMGKTFRVTAPSSESPASDPLPDRQS